MLIAGLAIAARKVILDLRLPPYRPPRRAVDPGLHVQHRNAPSGKAVAVRAEIQTQLGTRLRMGYASLQQRLSARRVLQIRIAETEDADIACSPAVEQLVHIANGHRFPQRQKSLVDVVLPS